MSSDDRRNSFLSCQVYIARLFRPRWAPQGGLRGWVTSFCAEYVGHAPATRAYKCTARSSRKPCSSFMVLVFSALDERIVRAFATAKSDRNLHDYFRQYIVIQYKGIRKVLPGR
ncbi:hypothetical protein ALC62_02658 [Cyphomyrmex costatus]|uniref:Uncharacterized protein n=1 Tax=Cyphomyrmex costatus TaxID=456900 RepID=A0A195D0D6_9HYME|nr:hypothetical protein ALC62_02658 [Cyphomyrmex costatus]